MSEDELWHGNDQENLEDALSSIHEFQRGEPMSWAKVEHVFLLAKPHLERELQELLAREDVPDEELHGIPYEELDPAEELPF